MEHHSVATSSPCVCHYPSFEGYRHHEVDVGSGVQMHVIDAGPLDEDVDTMLFIHGWPELALSWRHQVQHFANQGFRVLCPDLPGFGYSSCPHDTTAYSMPSMVAYLTQLLLVLHVPLESCVVVSHDWGGVIGWSMGLAHVDRLKGVASLCTPFFYPSKAPAEVQPSEPGSPNAFDYQAFFQREGVAEAQFAVDSRHSLNCIIRRPQDYVKGLDSTNVCARGGMLVGAPVDQNPSLLQGDVLTAFAKAFDTSGWRGGLSLYRNYVVNWEWRMTMAKAQLHMPCLMVTAGKDGVLKPSMTKAMPKFCTNLTQHHLPKSGHWIQQEFPDEVNQLLLDWLLKQVHAKRVERPKL